jgi:hypothetical protein
MSYAEAASVRSLENRTARAHPLLSIPTARTDQRLVPKCRKPFCEAAPAINN